jgi:hypothetical protein
MKKDKSKEPECYSTWEDGHEECMICKYQEDCKASTSRVNHKTAGLSRKRAMDAMCWECNGGTAHAPDCDAVGCPLYAFRRKNIRKPITWWMEPAKDWNRLSQLARGVDGETALLNSEDVEAE